MIIYILNILLIIGAFPLMKKLGSKGKGYALAIVFYGLLTLFFRSIYYVMTNESYDYGLIGDIISTISLVVSLFVIVQGTARLFKFGAYKHLN
jgi:hypothetical protein